MTGPSIIGSEKGIPTSTASAPAATTAARVWPQSSVMPPIRYGINNLRPFARWARSAFSSMGTTEDLPDLGHVLVAAPGQGDEDGRPLRQGGGARHPRHPGQCMCRLEGGNDALCLAQEAKGVQ